MWRASRSKAANERGRLLADQGRDDDALAAYHAAVELDPSNAAAWFNMALIHKFRRDWDEAARCGERAARRQPDDYATWWNLGIAATALGRWQVARDAWRHCGVAVPDGEGPIESLGLGPVPIRLSGDAGPEVVWAERLDPARARIANVPLPQSGHRWGDLVLHDGVPVGERVLDGRAVPVFEELERLEASEVPTLEAHVTAPGQSDSDDLTERFHQAGRAAEDWTVSVRHLCQTCSEGSVPARSENAEPWDPWRHFGLSADATDAEALLGQWAAAGAGRRRRGLTEVL